MGCLFTEGDHLYWDGSHPLAEKAVNSFLEFMEGQERSMGATMTVLRDFPENSPLNGSLFGHGFLRVQMPDSCTVDLKGTSSIGNYINQLSSRNRRHFSKDIQPFLGLTNCKVRSNLTVEEIGQVKGLFTEVQSRNLGLNTFPFPDRLFDGMNENPLWEFIVLRPMDQLDRVIGVMFCYNNKRQVYVPAFVGMDYSVLETFATYRQLLYATIERAIVLGLPKIDFGMTAAFEKRKLGAEVRHKYAYLQTRDNFILEMLGVMEGQQ